jgi:hypothetical protein
MLESAASLLDRHDRIAAGANQLPSARRYRS